MSGPGGEGLRVAGLRANHPHGPHVVHDVDLVAPRSQITALLGPNGAGKSSLLKALVGLLSRSGQITLDGEDLETLPPRERARRVAYVPQRTALLAPMPVREVVGLGRFAHRGPLSAARQADTEAVEQALVDAGAMPFADRRFTELSGGEQQRVLLARALATGATALLLDEPTSSQDVRQVLGLHAVLRALADRGCAVLIVLHDLSEVRRHADRAVLMNHGTIHAAGPVADIVRGPLIDEVYGVSLIEGGGLAFRLSADPGGAT